MFKNKGTNKKLGLTLVGLCFAGLAAVFTFQNCGKMAASTAGNSSNNSNSTNNVNSNSGNTPTLNSVSIVEVGTSYQVTFIGSYLPLGTNVQATATNCSGVTPALRYQIPLIYTAELSASGETCGFSIGGTNTVQGTFPKATTNGGGSTSSSSTSSSSTSSTSSSGSSSGASSTSSTGSSSGGSTSTSSSSTSTSSTSSGSSGSSGVTCQLYLNAQPVTNSSMTLGTGSPVFFSAIPTPFPPAGSNYPATWATGSGPDNVVGQNVFAGTSLADGTYTRIAQINVNGTNVTCTPTALTLVVGGGSGAGSATLSGVSIFANGSTFQLMISFSGAIATGAVPVVSNCSGGAKPKIVADLSGFPGLYDTTDNSAAGQTCTFAFSNSNSVQGTFPAAN